MNYLFDFQGIAYAPAGKVGAMNPEQIQSHNAQVEAADIQALRETGRGVLYVSPDKDRPGYGYVVSTWAGGLKIASALARKSRHNMAGPNGRLDVWFRWEGRNWHGINIGDNQVLRVKRLKSVKN